MLESITRGLHNHLQEARVRRRGGYGGGEGQGKGVAKVLGEALVGRAAIEARDLFPRVGELLISRPVSLLKAYPKKAFLRKVAHRTFDAPRHRE
jgi:hypothetical protein